MTTAQQRRLYFPAWGEAFSAVWFRDHGTVRRKEGVSPSIWIISVEDTAAAAARRVHGLVYADGLRHAAHVVALGRRVSSSDLSNKELDRVLVLFALLKDPEDIDALIRWAHPDQDARRRLLWAVQNVGWPAAYIAHVARAKYGQSDPEQLNDAQLRQLLVTLKERTKRRPAQPAQSNSDPF